jgi:hypothetical protein
MTQDTVQKQEEITEVKNENKEKTAFSNYSGQDNQNGTSVNDAKDYSILDREKKSDLDPSKSKSIPNPYYAICGDPLPWLRREIVGQHAVFDHVFDFWVFETKEEAEIVIKNNPKKCSKLEIRQRQSKIMHIHLHGTQKQKSAAAFRCRVEIKKKDLKKDEDKFYLDCDKAKIDKSILLGDVPKDFTENERTSYQKLKERLQKLRVF